MRLPTTLTNWAGATAFVVALFLSIGWAVSMVAAALDDDVSAQGIQLLGGLGGVLAGGVAGYLGAAAALVWRQKSDNKEDVDP
jgi:hypothetical protein